MSKKSGMKLQPHTTHIISQAPGVCLATHSRANVRESAARETKNMVTYCAKAIRIALIVAMAGALGAFIRTAAAQDDQSGVEAMTRGPVHEAFAEPVTFNPKPGIVVAKEPPAPVEELPPDEKPSGERVVWILGYWSWDDDRNDFIWVSGFWRVAPPDMNWVPGYWTKTSEGYQWTSGFWQPVSSSEVEYVPVAPPDSLEVGPSIPAPSSDRVWVSGCWISRHTRYAWRPGFWAQAYPDWVWVPAHYVWTPCGFVFVDGYWDYPVVRRGVLFAPVYIQPTVYVHRPRFYYTPSIVIDLNVLTVHLFCRPTYSHYYFGDYYSTAYVHLGFYPWYEYHHSHFGYDPIFVYERHSHRHDVTQWERSLQDDFLYRRDHHDARPPRTFAAQQTQVLRLPEADRSKYLLASSFKDVTSRKDSMTQFVKLSEDNRKQIAKQDETFRKFIEKRAKLETEPVAIKAGKESPAPLERRLTIPQLPTTFKTVETKDVGARGVEKAPPTRPGIARPQVGVPEKTQGRGYVPEKPLLAPKGKSTGKDQSMGVPPVKYPSPTEQTKPGESMERGRALPYVPGKPSVDVRDKATREATEEPGEETGPKGPVSPIERKQGQGEEKGRIVPYAPQKPTGEMKEKAPRGWREAPAEETSPKVPTLPEESRKGLQQDRGGISPYLPAPSFSEDSGQSKAIRAKPGKEAPGIGGPSQSSVTPPSLVTPSPGEKAPSDIQDKEKITPFVPVAPAPGAGEPKGKTTRTGPSKGKDAVKGGEPER